VIFWFCPDLVRVDPSRSRQTVQPSGSATTTHHRAHRGTPVRSDRSAGRGPALAGQRFGGPPGHHPGHPTACGGLPSSKPGLLLELMTLAVSVALGER